MPERLEFLVTELIRQRYGEEKSKLDHVIREIRLLDQYLSEAATNPDLIPKAYGLLLSLERDKAFQELVKKGVLKKEELDRLEEELSKAYQEYEILKEAHNHLNDPDWLLEAAKRNPGLADYFRRLALAALLRIYKETGDKRVAEKIAELGKIMPGYGWLAWLVNPQITDQDIAFILSKIGVITIPRNISFQCKTPLCRFWGELPEDVKKSLEKYALARYIADLIKQGDYEELASISTKAPELKPYIEMARDVARASTVFSSIVNRMVSVLRSVHDVTTARAAITGLSNLVKEAGSLVKLAEKADQEAQRLLGVNLGLANLAKELASVLGYLITGLVIYDNISENATALRLALENRDRNGVAKFFGRLEAAVMNAEDALSEMDCTRVPHFTALCKNLADWIGGLVTLGLDTLYNVYVAVMNIYPSLAEQLYKLYGGELNLPKPVKGKLGKVEEVYKEIVNYLSTVADKLHQEAEKIGRSDPVKTLEKMLESTGAYTLLYIIGIPVAAYQFARAEIGALAALLRANPGAAARIEKQLIEQMMPHNAEQLVAMALAGLALSKIGGAIEERLAEKPVFDKIYKVKLGLEERVLEALEKLSKKLGQDIEEIKVAEPGIVLERYTIAMDVAREAFDQAIEKYLESLPEEERLAVARMVSEELRKAIARNERLGDLVKRLEGEIDAYERLLEDLKSLRINLKNIGRVIDDIERLKRIGAWEELPDKYKYLQEIAAATRSILNDKLFRDALPDLAKELERTLAKLQKGSTEALKRVEYIVNIYDRLHRLIGINLVERLKAYVEEAKRIDPSLARDVERALEEYLRNPSPETWQEVEKVMERARFDLVKEELVREFPELSEANSLKDLEDRLTTIMRNVTGAVESVHKLWELSQRLEKLYERYAREDAELASMFKKLYEIVAEGEKKDIIELMKEGKLKEAMYRYVPRDLEAELEVYEKLSRLEKLVRGRPDLERLVKLVRENIDKPRVAQKLLRELENKIRSESSARAAAAKSLSETERPGVKMKEIVQAEKTLAMVFRASPETLEKLAEEAGKNKEIRIYCCDKEWIVERKLTVEPGRTVVEYLVRSGEDYARVVREYRIEDRNVYAITRIEYDPEIEPVVLARMTETIKKAAMKDTPLAVLVDVTGTQIPVTIPVPFAPVVNPREELEKAINRLNPVVTTVNGYPALRIGDKVLVLLTPEEAAKILPRTDWKPITIILGREMFKGYKVKIASKYYNVLVTLGVRELIKDLESKIRVTSIKTSQKLAEYTKVNYSLETTKQATSPLVTTSVAPKTTLKQVTYPKVSPPGVSGAASAPTPPGSGAPPPIIVFPGWLAIGGMGGAAGGAAALLRKEVLALL